MTELSPANLQAYMIIISLLMGLPVFLRLALLVWRHWGRWWAAGALALVGIASPLTGYQFGRIVVGLPPPALNTAVWRPYLEVYTLSVLSLGFALYFAIRVIAEEEARTKAARAELDKSRNDYLSVISHEVRTPLSAILGYVGMLKSFTVPGSIAEMVDGIYRGTARLRLVTQYTLAMNPRMDVEPFDVVDMIDHIISQHTDDLFTSTRHRPGDIFFTSHATHCTIEADRNKLETAVFELIRNAIKVSSTGATIVITSSKERKFVTINVQDTGLGIAYADQQRVWEHGIQLYDDIMTRPNEGSGLGLAMVAQVAKLHHGWCGLVSSTSSGSVFSLHIPIRTI